MRQSSTSLSRAERPTSMARTSSRRCSSSCRPTCCKARTTGPWARCCSCRASQKTANCCRRKPSPASLSPPTWLPSCKACSAQFCDIDAVASQRLTVALLSAFVRKIQHYKASFSQRCLTLAALRCVCVLCSVQAAGISLWASSKGSGNPNKNIINLGNYITLAGLAFQLCAFGVFVILAVWTHRHPG